MLRLMTTSLAFQRPTPPLLRRRRGDQRPCLCIHTCYPRRFRADLAKALRSAYAYGLVQTIAHTTPQGRLVTLFLAIRSRLAPPLNHVDQYRYASVRSRHNVSVAMPPTLPVFHVKP